MIINRITFFIGLFCCYGLNGICQESKSEIFIIRAWDLSLYDGELSQFDDYYGLFLNEETSSKTQKFRVEKIDTHKYFKGDRVTNNEQIKEDRLFLVFAGMEVDTSNVKGWIPEFLYPGQTFAFNNYRLFATGEVIENNEAGSFEPITGFKNYQLKISKWTESGVKQQIILTHKLLKLYGKDYLSNSRIEWMGDLNGDGKLELLITIVGYEDMVTELFISIDDDSSDVLNSVIRYTLGS
jgi:hypothetical protein